MSWEIIRWIDGTGRVQMCESKEVAERLLSSTYSKEEQKNYHIREYRKPLSSTPIEGKRWVTDSIRRRRMKQNDENAN